MDLIKKKSDMNWTVLYSKQMGIGLQTNPMLDVKKPYFAFFIFMV